ncbi:MAG: linear amide C-N hydrolase [Proteobacteria bacterium]|nr:linear amide C-N hydrolase [Pseudomonadota bacterium]
MILKIVRACSELAESRCAELKKRSLLWVNEHFSATSNAKSANSEQALITQIGLWGFASCIAFFAVTRNLDACSSFFASNKTKVGGGYLAANYDWQVKGGIVFSEPRGLKKTGFLPKKDFGQGSTKTKSWTSRYSSIVMTQWGVGFPVQGMNEVGLSGVVLNGPAQYQSSDDSRSSVTELQWLQMQLDLFESIDEVSNHINDSKIVKLSGDLHYMFCDASGECMIVEFISGFPKITRKKANNRFAITNSALDFSLKSLEAFEDSFPDSLAHLPSTYRSIDRFIRASIWSDGDYLSPLPVFAKLINLSGVGMTQWHTVFDSAKREIFLMPFGSETYQKFLNSDFLQHCSQNARAMRRIDSSIEADWQTYDHDWSTRLLARASKNVPGYTTENLALLSTYVESETCSSDSRSAVANQVRPFAYVTQQ